ncbi:hypothetical protein BSNK01_25800 [Bacillaceae bacterium]
MKNNGYKVIFLLLLFATGVTMFAVFDLHQLSPAVIRDFILSFGWWAPLLYIFLYTIRPLFFFPAILLSLSGGLAFGPWWGTLYDLIGASLGSYLAFGISRKLGRDAMERWLGKRLRMIDERVQENGFRTILFLRLIPLMPFDVVNYGAGLSKIRFRDYALATVLGILPGAFAYNFLGHSLHDMFSPQFFAALGLAVVLSLAPTCYKWLTKRMSTKNGMNRIKR